MDFLIENNIVVDAAKNTVKAIMINGNSGTAGVGEDNAVDVAVGVDVGVGVCVGVAVGAGVGVDVGVGAGVGVGVGVGLRAKVAETVVAPSTF